MAEDGESPRIVKANELKREAASGISRMRANADGNVLGGPTDPRPGIETGLGMANDKPTALQARLDRVPRAPVTQTSVGKRILADLAEEVGHELTPTASVVEIPQPGIKTQSPTLTIIDKLKSVFGR